MVSELGPVVGTHLGPGVLGVAGLKIGNFWDRCRRHPFRRERESPARCGVPLDPPKRRERAPARARRSVSVGAGDPSHRCSSVLFALSLYLIYLLRKPISWILIAAFLAVALSGPVNVLSQRMRRGLRDRARLPRAAADPGRDRARSSCRRSSTQRNNLIDDLPALRARRPGLRREEQDACAARGGLQHHREAAAGGEQAPGQARRRGRDVLGDIGLGLVNSLFAGGSRS